MTLGESERGVDVPTGMAPVDLISSDELQSSEMAPVDLISSDERQSSEERGGESEGIEPTTGDERRRRMDEARFVEAVACGC